MTMHRSMDGRAKRVGICVFNYPCDTCPTIVHVVTMLADHGYYVDLFTDRLHHSELRFDDPRISLKVKMQQDIGGGDGAGRGWVADPLPSPVQRTRSRLRRWIPDWLLARTRRWRDRYVWGPLTLVNYLWRVATCAQWVLRSSWRRRYTCLIGVEPDGLIVATAIGKLRRIPVLYHSLELHLSDEYQALRWRPRKALERWSSRQARLTLIQDEERAEALAVDNDLLPSRIKIVPVAELGPPHRERTHYLHQRLGIPTSKTIILYIGGINSRAMCLELAQAARSWPDDWVLVLHGFADDLAYINQIRQAMDPDRVRLSLDLVPYEELDALVSSADIGVALYRNLNKNHYYIASASGKLAHYLKCGLPVIAIDFPGVRRLFEAYRCGFAAGDEQHVAGGIRTILGHYDRFRAEAFRCYSERYDFSLYFEDVIRYIDQCL